jgi:CspA family cold shock protein
MSKLTGKVKWFNSAKGYGFLNTDEHPKDIFIHYSSIEMDGYKTLEEGMEVEFELEDGPKGPTALNVTKAEEK